MISARPVISKSSSLFNNLSVTVSKAPITIGLIATSYYYFYFTLCELFTPALADGLSLEFEWQQVSSSLQNLRILVDLKKAVDWMVSARTPISKFSRPFIKPLKIVAGSPIKIGTTLTPMFNSLFLVLWQGLSICLPFLFPWF